MAVKPDGDMERNHEVKGQTMLGPANWGFSEWNEHFPLGGFDALQTERIGESSCFAMSSMTSPLPGSSYSQVWHWTDDPRVLLGLTRNVILPSMIATWFFEQFDGDRLRSSEYLRRARETGSFLDDIPIAQSVVDAVEYIDSFADREVILSGLQDAAALFNERFGRTRTWDLSFQVYPSLEGAAKGYWAPHFNVCPPVYQGQELTEDRWIEVCLSAGRDPVANEFVVEQFQEVFG